MSKNNDNVHHEELQRKLRRFSLERDWAKFHSVKNLSMALSVEASELVELFQWLTEAESNKLSNVQKERVEEELADIFLYLLQLSDATKIDLIEAAHKKIAVNAEKYPVSSSYSNAKKYSDL